jgi:S-adenosylmethionine uptake transporter
MICFVFMTRALALTPASVLAPFQYTAILWATALGWLVWRDGLSFPVAFGNLLIIASGLVVLRVERRHVGVGPVTNTTST